MRNYYAAYLRAVRDYCNAYHGGSTRKAMIDLLIKTGTENRPQILHEYPWPARSPKGKINIDSMLDMQAWYVKSKMSNAAVAARAPGADRLHPRGGREARAVRAREQGQQAARDAGRAAGKLGAPRSDVSLHASLLAAAHSR